jgi:cellobiose transport system substrate-binding protein
MIGQSPEGFYDASDKVVVASNPVVKQAWDRVTAAVEDGQSAELAPFTNDWNVGLRQGRFATITCPAWMTTQIEQQAKSAAGKWDVATIPGGAGNWGGSFLTVPRQGKHIEEAIALATWLTAPEQQAAVFKKSGILPSQPKLYKDPSITGQTKPFFNDAPVGRIFTDSALRLKPQPQGPATGEIQLIIGRGMTRVEQGRQSPDDAWRQALTEVDRAAESD